MKMVHTDIPHDDPVVIEFPGFTITIENLTNIDGGLCQVTFSHVEGEADVITHFSYGGTTHRTQMDHIVTAYLPAHREDA